MHYVEGVRNPEQSKERTDAASYPVLAERTHNSKRHTAYEVMAYTRWAFASLGADARAHTHWILVGGQSRTCADCLLPDGHIEWKDEDLEAAQGTYSISDFEA